MLPRLSHSSSGSTRSGEEAIHDSGSLGGLVEQKQVATALDHVELRSWDGAGHHFGVPQRNEGVVVADEDQ